MSRNIDTITISGLDDMSTTTVDFSDTITLDLADISGTSCSYPWDLTTVPLTTTASNQLQLNGHDADIVINGESLNDRLKKIEDRLNILVTNPVLEAEWNQLRELGERYRALEAEIQQKQKAWQALQQT